MRHYKKGRKLGTDASHTNAIKKNLVVNIFTNDRIKTTLERAKEIRGDIDQVITWAKRGDVHSRRLAIAKLGDKRLVGEVFAKVEQGMFKDRPGGYSRIMRLGTRRGDSATIVIMELVQEPYVKKASKDVEAAPAKKAPTRRTARRAEKATDKKVVEK
jgi:large subunit ribosomal protein L17